MEGTLFDCGFSVVPTRNKFRKIEVYSNSNSNSSNAQDSSSCALIRTTYRISGDGKEDSDNDEMDDRRPFRLSEVLQRDVVCVEDDEDSELSCIPEKSTSSSKNLRQQTSSVKSANERKITEKENPNSIPSLPINMSSTQQGSKNSCTSEGTLSVHAEKQLPTQNTSSSTWLLHLLPQDTKWRDFLSPITADKWKNKLFYRIEVFLKGLYDAGVIVYPPYPLIFEAFRATPFGKVKVILLGQDPYHEPNQAHGLSFSVSPGVPLPPSLRNIYQELSTDIPGFEKPKHGNLLHWATQGVLLLNATLTVTRSQANSHAHCGWREFTDAVIELLSKFYPERLVFLLWGKFAEKKKALINTVRHTVLINAHPSPLSAHRGWFGCRCFSRCNEALEKMGREPIDWKLPLSPVEK